MSRPPPPLQQQQQQRPRPGPSPSQTPPPPPHHRMGPGGAPYQPPQGYRPPSSAAAPGPSGPSGPYPGARPGMPPPSPPSSQQFYAQRPPVQGAFVSGPPGPGMLPAGARPPLSGGGYVSQPPGPPGRGGQGSPAPQFAAGPGVGHQQQPYQQQPYPQMSQPPYGGGGRPPPGAPQNLVRPMMAGGAAPPPQSQQSFQSIGPVTAADIQQAQHTASAASPTDGTGEHPHRRRTAYPKELATAYTGGADVDPFGGGVYGGPSDSTGQAPPTQDTQQPQYFTPGIGAAGPTQFAQPGQAPGSEQGYDQNAVAGQFAKMSVGGPASSTSRPLNPVSLMGAPPNVADLHAPPPPILLDPTASVTRSPHSQCDPSYKRCTINAIPQTPGLLNKSRLPFGLIITPFKTLAETEKPVPTVSDSTITRCRRCRTYINPFVQFVEGGNRWKCNLCYLLNDIPNTFDYDQLTGQPVDRWQRAELNHAVVEFIAPTEYMVRPPQPLVYLFLIDVSYGAVQSGMVATTAKTILDALDHIPNEENRTKIGFITVDSALHFYGLGPEQAEPQMLVVADLEETFLPQPEDLLCNLSESREQVESLLGRMADMFKDTQNVGNVLGPGLSAAYKLISPIGGKILVFQSTLPNAGPGALKAREDPALLGTAKESTLLQPASAFYKNLAVDGSRTQVTVDMFLFGQQYVDVATLSCTPRYTGGTTFFYPNFNAGRTEDAIKFAQELADHLSALVGLEAVMRVRASKGLRMSAYHGNFFVRSTDLLALPSVTPDHSYAVEMMLDENVNSPVVSFQTALLHTTCYGERRIRVLTLALPVTSLMQDLYASADQLAIADLLARKAVERALTAKLEDARDALTNKMIDILGVYKTSLTASASGATAQLTLCENLKLLPLLILAMIKHVAFQKSPRIRSDFRAYAMALMNTLPPEALASYLHPRFYALHRLPPNVGTPGEDGSGARIMPPPLNLSSEKLERHGVYLLDMCESTYVWVGRDAHPQLCMDLFDAPNVDALRTGKFIFPALDTDVSIATQLILTYTRQLNRAKIFPHTYLVKEDGDLNLRTLFLSNLVEDRTGDDFSYHQYLGTLKEKVNNGSF